jgi:hypothetical protein
VHVSFSEPHSSFKHCRSSKWGRSPVDMRVVRKMLERLFLPSSYLWVIFFCDYETWSVEHVGDFDAVLDSDIMVPEPLRQRSLAQEVSKWN